MTALTDAKITDIKESYDLTNWGTIANPGKFEGQPLWVAVAYEDSGHGYWEYAYSDGNGGACSEYTEINPGAYATFPDNVPARLKGMHRAIQQEDWEARMSLGIDSKTHALIIHTDSQGEVSGEEATKAELDAWLERVGKDENQRLRTCPECETVFEERGQMQDHAIEEHDYSPALIDDI